ncbi:MAG: DNA repair protein RecN, partial [Acidimicrobiales bacterium]
VLARLARVIAGLPPGGAYDAARRELDAALARAREVARDLAALGDDAVVDDATMNALDERVAELQRVARKFGGSLADVLDALAELRRRRDELDDAEGRLASLDADIAGLTDREGRLAATAREQRVAAAATLSAAVAHQLPRVALAGATLDFVVSGVDGSEVEVLFAPNPGRPAGSLAAMASGGELSRVLLALALETVHDEVVAVFDEIDAGVGGQVAQQIGECLRELGHEQQVLAVTHLASVAAKADHHVVIEKVVKGAATSTVVREVTGEQRVREVARMMVGDRVTDESLALASQMLETSN